MDWGVGHYELTAARLAPAAHVVVDHAAVGAGERVVDVGCGTGNAALLAAERGARVTGVDPAARLLEVARTRVAASGLHAVFVLGEAADLPLGDGEAEVVLSVFGVIFAPDAAAAAREIARVTAPAGRIVLSAWTPRGAIRDCVGVMRTAIGRAVGAAPGPPPFAWHDRDALAGLLAPHGFGAIAIHEHRLAFTAASARDYVDGELGNHPLAITSRAILEPRGDTAPLRERMVAILDDANEDPDAFCVTSSYVVAIARRGRA